MLKLNTVLTALGLVLLALISFIGKSIWDDVAATKAATISASVRMEYMTQHMDEIDKHLEYQDRRLDSEAKDIEYIEAGQSPAHPHPSN
jgi:hypothetical protein